MSMFSAVEMAPRDPILGLNEQFAADSNPKKVNLGVGVYYDDNGKLPLLACVQKAEQAMMSKPSARGYLPIDGIAAYDSAVQALVFGAQSLSVLAKRVATVQCLGGTGGLKVGADFLKRLNPQAKVLISDPSWENHKALFTQAGFEVQAYPYYDAQALGVNFPKMLASLASAQAGSIVVLHACCHNPTGYDITPSQWQQVVETVKAKGLTAFLDMAYQGFGHGIAEDGAVIDLFVQAGLSFFVAGRQSVVTTENCHPHQLFQPTHPRWIGCGCCAQHPRMAQPLGKRAGWHARSNQRNASKTGRRPQSGWGATRYELHHPANWHVQLFRFV